MKINDGNRLTIKESFKWNDHKDTAWLQLSWVRKLTFIYKRTAFFFRHVDIIKIANRSWTKLQKFLFKPKNILFIQFDSHRLNVKCICHYLFIKQKDFDNDPIDKIRFINRIAIAMEGIDDTEEKNWKKIFSHFQTHALLRS